MKKESLGAIIRDRRREFSLSQRALAQKLGVKGSYVAYLEGGRRRPSFALITRLADVLALDRQRLFFLSHPEAAAMVRTNGASSEGGGAWKKFAANRALVTRHRITPRELKVLREVGRLGPVASPGQFIFILNSIRQAMEPE
ncbi:MAG TPA: helix-turn-helix transcriptional regulator [Candidatus Binataceae bacterium]|nr:helix-turn-helix transcriptional regulator [Candidatus Binataceae bacterium]